MAEQRQRRADIDAHQYQSNGRTGLANEHHGRQREREHEHQADDGRVRCNQRRRTAGDAIPHRHPGTAAHGKQHGPRDISGCCCASTERTGRQTTRRAHAQGSKPQLPLAP